MWQRYFICALFVTVAHLACSWADDQAHMDVFHLGDTNNDTSLDINECLSMWKTFDVDNDDFISKLELVFKWTFLNLQSASHSPLFFRIIDVNFDKRIDADEMNKICRYFDDDEDGEIGTFEFDFNWKGLFSL